MQLISYMGNHIFEMVTHGTTSLQIFVIQGTLDKTCELVDLDEILEFDLSQIFYDWLFYEYMRYYELFL